MPNALEIRGLTKAFAPRFTLGPLDLTVPPGAIYGRRVSTRSSMASCSAG
jgi:hypothetical protein